MNKFYNLKNFDWKIYLEKNKDLVENNINTEKDALNHFKKHGINEKRFINNKMVELWENYDWNKYKNNYFELNTLDEYGAFLHYYFNGQENNHNIFKKEEILFFKNKENYEKYNDLYKFYNWEKYLDFYQDLKDSNIKTTFECFIHYINHGINEERQIFKKKNI